MNMDTKNLNKMIPNQIQEHMKRILYHEQEKFIAGMQRCFNFQKSIIIHYISKLKRKTTQSSQQIQIKL